MLQVREVLHSTYKACTEPDPADPAGTPFLAQAIISNPPTYGEHGGEPALCRAAAMAACTPALLLSGWRMPGKPTHFVALVLPCLQATSTAVRRFLAAAMD